MAEILMKVMVNEKFGSPDVFELKEIEIPVLEGNEVLIKTYGSSVNTIDIFFRSGMKILLGLSRLVTGIKKPKRKILGFDIAGEIVEIGVDVTEFKVGDQVYGGASSGANAEYTRARDTQISLMPSSMNYFEAGVVPVAGLSALQGLRVGNIQKGQKVLINGASGGIGTYAVQLAKSYGTTVTAVASGKNGGLVTSLGADVFIDYTKEDFTEKGDKYDLIFDTVGKLPLSKWKNNLKENGVFVNAGSPQMAIIVFQLRMMGNKFRKKKLKTFDTQYVKRDLEYLAKLADEGKIKSIIDKSFTLEEIADAHRYYEIGHTAGKVAVIIREDKEDKEDN